jgi:hypothetical protein
VFVSGGDRFSGLVRERGNVGGQPMVASLCLSAPELINPPEFYAPLSRINVFTVQLYKINSVYVGFSDLTLEASLLFRFFLLFSGLLTLTS